MTVHVPWFIFCDEDSVNIQGVAGGGRGGGKRNYGNTIVGRGVFNIVIFYYNSRKLHYGAVNAIRCKSVTNCSDKCMQRS